MMLRRLCPVAAAVFTMFLSVSVAQAQAEGGAEPTHAETQVIGGARETAFGELGTVCLTADGRVLAGDTKRDQIRVYSQDGNLLATWSPGVRPDAIYACADGTVYVGGAGRLAKLDKDGNTLRSVAAAEGNFPSGKVSSIAASDRDVFVSFGVGGSLGARDQILRFDRDLGGSVAIARDLRGCCQRLDLKTRDGVLYVAENTLHHVVKYDRDGNVLSQWGKQDRKGVEGFGSCCNPMNLCFGVDGSLYTAESGLGRIKRYDVDGKFLGLVGFVEVPRFTSAGGLAASCSNIAIAVSADGRRVFVQDVKNNVIRVLTAKAAAPSPAPAAKDSLK
jgi:sugar lactone lactonase YvrE